MQNYRPMPGEKIDETAETMVTLAKEHKEPVTARFNGISLTAKPHNSPVDILESFNLHSDRRQTEYRKSPAYAKRKAQEEEETKRKQAIIDQAVKELSTLNFSKLPAVINWLDSIQEATDWIHVLVPKKFIMETFERNGFEANVNCGDSFNSENEDNSGRWLIGQALDGIKTVGAIHGMFHSFARDWRARFGHPSPGMEKISPTVD